jgi:hypothetical protein
MTSSSIHPPGEGDRLRLQIRGGLLFLFIPVVLFLFVRHPQPIWLSLAAGIVLMLGHRALARPYMERVLPVKCVWCNRIPPAGPIETLILKTGGGDVTAQCCAGHRRPAAQYFSFLDRNRLVMRAGIFLPLLLLLITLGLAAAGKTMPVGTVTAIFQGVVGLTVNLAAFGYLWTQERSPVEVPFPVHNFFLLGVKILIWIFRIVGIAWIAVAIYYFLRQASYLA